MLLSVSMEMPGEVEFNWPEIKESSTSRKIDIPKTGDGVGVHRFFSKKAHLTKIDRVQQWKHEAYLPYSIPSPIHL